MVQDTAAIRLLGLIALAGEFPTAALGKLIGEGRYKEKIITELKAKKLIKGYSRDGIRAYRLTRGGKRQLLKENPTRYTPLLRNAAQSRTDPPHRLRQHQMCEVQVVMQKAGIRIFPDEKPSIFTELPPSKETRAELLLPAYYTSLEVKGRGLEGTKIKGARFCGVLLTECNIYLVYNSGDSLMRWDRKSEIKSRAMITHLLCRERLPERYAQANAQGILLGADMETANHILNAPTNKNARVFQLDQTFEHFHFIPWNAQGDLLLQLLCREDIGTQLKSLLSEGLRPADSGAPIENDGFEEDGSPVLFSFDGDLQRLSKFVNMLQLQERQGVVYCFDFQTAAFGHYCGACARMQSISLEKFKQRFLPPEGSCL